MTKTLKDKFEKLSAEHRKIAQARRDAASHRAGIKGIGGPLGDLTALASDIGSAAVATELTLLKAERRALKRLHAFAVSAVSDAAKGRS